MTEIPEIMMDDIPIAPLKLTTIDSSMRSCLTSELISEVMALETILLKIETTEII